MPVAGLEADRALRDANGTANLTDLEVFALTAEQQGLWKDPHYTVSEHYSQPKDLLSLFKTLADSADLEVWPRYLLNFYKEEDGTEIACVKSVVLNNEQQVLEERLHRLGLTRDPHNVADYERQVYTLPPGSYEVRAYAYEDATCSGEARLHPDETLLKQTFTFSRGADRLWDPVHAVTDVDDGSPSGAQMTYIGTQSSNSTGEPDGVANDLEAQANLMFQDFTEGARTSNFEGEDADANERLGDGEVVTDALGYEIHEQHVDMSDFRQMRNWLLHSEGLGGNTNGSRSHPKKQISGDSTGYLSANLNRDDIVDFNTTAPILGLEDDTFFVANSTTFAVSEGSVVATTRIVEREDDGGIAIAGGELSMLSTGGAGQNATPLPPPLLSDFDVFYQLLLKSENNAKSEEDALWQDDYVKLFELPKLISSGDLEIWPRLLLETPEYGVTRVETSIAGVQRSQRTYTNDVTDPHEEGYKHQVYTLQLRDDPYEVTVRAFGRDGKLFETTFDFTPELGGSVLIDPSPRALDIDNGTPDGNQLQEIATKTAGADADEDGVADDLKDDELLELSGSFDGLDADKDEHLGNGEQRVALSGDLSSAGNTPKVDMRDFRRLRDWLLAAEGTSFEGSVAKVDTSEGSLARLWGDYNRDGKLSADERQVVFDLETSKFSAVSPSGDLLPRTAEPYEFPRLTDYEVFHNLVKRDRLWQDEDYTLDDTADLLESGDIEIWPRSCLKLSRLKAGAPIISTIDGKTYEHVGDERDTASHIITLPGGSYDAEVTVTLDLGEGKTKEIKVTKTFEVEAGSDDLWDPMCVDVRYYFDDEEFSLERDGDTPGETGAKSDPLTCPLAKTEIKMTVEGAGLTPEGVTFTGIDSDKGEVTQEGNLVTYTESAEELEPETYTLSVEITTPPEEESSEAFKDERSFVLAERECSLEVTGGNPALGEIAPVLGTHSVTQTCDVPVETFADVTVSVKGRASGNEVDKDYLIDVPPLTGITVSGVVSGAAEAPAEPGGTWTFEQEAQGLSGTELYTTQVQLTFEGDFTREESGTFEVKRETSEGADNCPPTGPGPNPDVEKFKYEPIKLTQYKPRVRPRPSSYGGGWGCFGNCTWGGGGGGGWGGWSWGLSGFGLIETPVAKTFGDPHITTADGVAYSSMKLGEFVYARSTLPGGVEVQARQTRLPNFADWASFNTGAAVSAGGHVFEIQLPESRKQGDDLILLIDGEVAELPPGRYTFSDAFVEIKAGNELIVYYAEPSIAQDTYQSTATRVRIGTMTENALVRPDPETDILSLEISINTPPVGRYRGLFGTPDGDANNEAMLPNGRFPETWDGFLEGWRVTSKSDSLFTYAPGEGPETYNLAQDAEMPAPDELLGTNESGFTADAEALLRETCEADLSAVDPSFVRSVALELAAGRPASHMIDSGICLDEHVDGAGEPEVLLSGLRLEGQLTLQGQPEIEIPGATVTVYSPTLGTTLCETGTFKRGRYTCGGSFDTPSTSTIELLYTITGRGAPVTYRATVPTPRGGAWDTHKEDFQISLERVLHLTGQVIYASGVGVKNAKLQVSGPAYLQAEADAQGYYDIYAPLPDGVTVGVLTLEATEEDSRGYAKSEENLLLAETGIIELQRDLLLEPDKVPEPSAAADKRTLVFIGRIINAYGEVGVGGVPVSVSAPGYIKDDRCEAVTSSHGIYNGYFTCHATLLTEEAFSATLSARNFGSAVTESITVTPDDFPAKGATKGKEIGTFSVRPTTLRVKGAVRVPGVAEVDAQVIIDARASGKSLATITMNTALTGDYDTLLSLPDSAPRSLELHYKVTVKTPNGALTTTSSQPVQHSGQPVVTDVSHDVAFVTYRFAFVGKVVNALEPSVGVKGATLKLTRSGSSTSFCQTVSNDEGFYTCEYETGTPEPFAVQVQASGYGSASETV